MRFGRLGWAGLEVEAGGERIVVDHLVDPGILGHFIGDSPEPLLAPEPGTCAAALVTHLHRDHADPAAIERALGDDGDRPAAGRASAVRSELDELATGEAEAALGGARTRSASASPATASRSARSRSPRCSPPTGSARTRSRG